MAEPNALDAYKLDQLKADLVKANERIEELIEIVSHSGVNSPNMLVRMFTAWGYVIGAQFIVGLVIFVIYFVIVNWR